MRSPYKELENQLGYRFRRKHHLETALTHPSYRHEHADIESDNQRLEFLGDAVLGLVTAEYFYREYPDMAEGDLTRIRSQVSNSKFLAHIAATICLGEHLRLGRGELLSGGKDRPSNLTDAVEAVVGAAYLDGGLRAVAKLFKQLWMPELESVMAGVALENTKGALQEWAQVHWKVSPTYKIIEQTGPAHARQYTAAVTIRSKVYGKGRGRNKREAEMEAAREALRKVQDEKPDQNP